MKSFQLSKIFEGQTVQLPREKQKKFDKNYKTTPIEQHIWRFYRRVKMIPIIAIMRRFPTSKHTLKV